MSWLREDKLLLLCSRMKIVGEAKGKIGQILGDSLNWDYILEKAFSQRISPLLYYNLRDKEAVPDKIKERLREIYDTNSARNILLLSELGKVLETFNQAKIPVIVLKGAALLETVYSNIGLRPIADLDLLVHKKDFSLAESKLKGLGYNNSVFYPEDFHKDNMMVDVHWELMNITRVKSRKKSYCIDIDEVWRSSIPIEINREKARILSPECCLMDLCLHLSFHHGLQGLMWFIDIARLIEYYKNEIDWNKFIQKSFEYKICRPVYYVLFYVKEILGQRIPRFVLDGLRPKRQNFLEGKIFDLILSGASLGNIRFFFTLSTMENLLDRLLFLREISLPSPRVLSARYNITSRRYIPQYYLIHFKSIFSSIFKLLQKVSLA